MKALQWKEWRLSMSPVPLLFLLLSGLILIPNYPYYVTFFYNGLGLFMLMQSLRENRDTAYLMLLPVTKAEMVRARFRTVVQLELLQVLACVPFMALRASYGHLNNAVGIEANTAFLGLGLVQMGLLTSCSSRCTTKTPTTSANRSSRQAWWSFSTSSSPRCATM